MEFGAGGQQHPCDAVGGGTLTSGQVGPCASWRLVPGSSPLLPDSDEDVLLCHAHRAASIQTQPRAGGHCLPLARVEFPAQEHWQGLNAASQAQCCPFSSAVTSW